MRWRYGIVRNITETESSTWHDDNLHEIYVDDDDKILGWTKEPCSIGISYIPDDPDFGDHEKFWETILRDIAIDLKDHEQPVVYVKDGKEWLGNGYSWTTQTS